MNGGRSQGYVESANKTHRQEFYEVEDIGLRLEEHNKQLEEWDKTYNYIRPHRALDMQTPNEYYLQWKRIRRAQVSRMC